jgi:bacterioferritin
MGKQGRAIIGMDIDELVGLLNKALADEWLAYYQYWVGAKVLVGPMKGEVAAELNVHATEELGHANLLADRIMQLGGTPVISPEKWLELTNCGYDAPDDPYVEAVLNQNLNGERCAIKTYNNLLTMLEGKDVVTYNMVLSILTDELEHEEDIEAMLQDMEWKGFTK